MSRKELKGGKMRAIDGDALYKYINEEYPNHDDTMRILKSGRFDVKDGGEPQSKQMEGGPYKLQYDHGLREHVLTGPGIEDGEVTFSTNLEGEPRMDDLNSAFLFGRSSRQAEIVSLKLEIDRLRDEIEYRDNDGKF